MLCRGLVTIGAALLIGASSAQAATRFAEPGGDGLSGLNQCLQTDPCGLEPAIEDASVVDGDEVVLLPGTYNIAAATLSVGDAITIRPRDAGTRPTLTGTDDTILSLSDDATVRDIAIQNTTTTGTGGALTSFAPNPLVERVVVESTVTGGTQGQFACVLFDGTLRDSVCRMIESSMSNFGVALASSIASPTGTYTPRFVNVTAAGTNTVTPLMARAGNPSINIAITAHNVIAPFVLADATSQVGSTASVSLTNSNFQSSTGQNGGVATPAGSPTNQTALPVFANAATGDFHQLAASPTINAGATDAFLGTQDFDFEARNQGAAPDIGADEFNVPATPSITDTDPDSPANDNAPEVKGTAVAGSTVRIYSGSDCSGPVLASGSAAQFASPGITTPVPGDTTSNLRATASDALNHASACSAAFPYQEDSTPPATPTITDTDPDSPSSDNAPEVKGTAEAASTVRIYSSSDCSGSPLASGSAAQFASPGITVSVPSDTTTNLRATATDVPGNTSSCSAAFPYIEASTPPAPPADSVAPETRIDLGPKATVKTKKKKVKVSIAFSANETATFRCSLDGAAPASCSSPFSATVKKGTHTFEVTATDSAGNADSTPATTTWKVKRKKRKH